MSKQRSTCTNLLESLNYWTLSVQTKQQITVVYIDFSKAFDVVSHNKLFARLYSYGIRGTESFERVGTVSCSHSLLTVAASLAISGIFSVKELPDLEI